MGGQLQLLPGTQTRWYLADLESAEFAADQGQIGMAARLMRAAYRDGVLAGVLSTRTSGLVHLPKRFSGDPEIVAALELGSTVEARSVFDEMCPSSELHLIARDGVTIGVGVGELVPVEGRDYPVLVRLDPEFLYYVWAENRWYFRSSAGTIPIVPGDGRWVLHTPGGRMSPWSAGLWRALGQAFIRKMHANLHKDNWEAKLANPARVATAPLGATEEQKQGFFRRVMAWGINTVFSLMPGWDVKLLESNGRGYESFRQTIDDQNNEFVVAVAGQTVTMDGGAGFSNADVHKTIRADLIEGDAAALAYTINTQIIPQFVATRFGEERIANGALLAWDVAPPKDKTAEATTLTQAASAITQITDALAKAGSTAKLDVDAMATRFGIPLIRETQAVDRNAHVEEAEIVQPKSLTASTGDEKHEPSISDVKQTIDLARGAGLQPTTPSLRLVASRVGLDLEPIPVGTSEPKRLVLAPTDIAKVVTANEVRSSQGLPPFTDERGGKTISELDASATAPAPTQSVPA